MALRIGVGGNDLGYAIDFGLPIPSNSLFALDPVIKREAIWHGNAWSPRASMFERDATTIRARDQDGRWQLVSTEIRTDESALAFVADPRATPEVFALRETVRSWRFYDHFRTDRDAPVRTLQIGTYTPALHHDGHDLAAALQTIVEVGDAGALAAAVDDAFPRARLSISVVATRMGLEFKQHGLLRALDQSELSDGTLRYFLWLAALLTPRPPPLLVLNEPETSLHPDLLEPLARLITHASTRTQVWVVSHAPGLVAALRKVQSCSAIELVKMHSATEIVGQERLERPHWTWPRR